MIFHSVSKFAFISDCENYKVVISRAGCFFLYSCFRVNQDNPGAWDNINENKSSYLTYQAARLRIQWVHDAEPEKAYKTPPNPVDKATNATRKKSLTEIRGRLSNV